ncbi:MAG: hypothetical protein M1835_000609 [Candelina submexicana]|nr:MAG: hypothetical protein M1835_000609 [Candelina submexicana]
MLFLDTTFLIPFLPLLLQPITALQSPTQVRSLDSSLAPPAPVNQVLYGIRLPALSFCTPEISQKLAVSANRASNLVRAALNAASYFTEQPYTFFFPPNIETANSISSLYAAALAVLNGTAPGPRIYCIDIDERCAWNNKKWSNSGFGPRQGGIPGRVVNYGYVRDDYFLTGETAIVICQDDFSKTLYNPPPCSKFGGGLYTSEWIILNLVLQAINTRQLASKPSSATTKKLKSNSITAIDCHDILITNPAENKGEPQDESNCVADLASWAWDLGFGVSPEWTGSTCADQGMYLSMWARQTFSKGVTEGGSLGSWGAG